MELSQLEQVTKAQEQESGTLTGFSLINDTELKQQIRFDMSLEELQSDKEALKCQEDDVTIPLNIWFYNLCKKVSILRELAVNTKTLKAIYQQLELNNFTYHQRKIAEIWILQGNWSSKKAQALTYDDFYPRAEDIKNMSEILIMKSELQSLVNTIRKLAYDEFNSLFITWKQVYEEERLAKEFINDNSKGASLVKLIELQDAYIKMSIPLEAYKKKLQILLESSIKMGERISKMEKELAQNAKKMQGSKQKQAHTIDINVPIQSNPNVCTN